MENSIKLTQEAEKQTVELSFSDVVKIKNITERTTSDESSNIGRFFGYSGWEVSDIFEDKCPQPIQLIANHIVLLSIISWLSLVVAVIAIFK